MGIHFFNEKKNTFKNFILFYFLNKYEFKNTIIFDYKYTKTYIFYYYYNLI